MDLTIISDNLDATFCGMQLLKESKGILFAHLDRAISPNGTSRALDEELHTKAEQLRTTKERYFELEILYETVRNMCLESSLDDANSNFDKVKDAVNLALIDSQVEQTLQCLKIDNLEQNKHDGNLFNLTGIQKETLTAVEGHILHNLVAKKIRTRSIDLAKYYGQLANPNQTPQPEMSRELWLSKAGRLSAIVESKKVELSEQKASKRLAERQHFKALRDYYEVLLKVVQSLWNLGEIISMHNSDLVETKELQIEIKAVLGKLRLLKLEILADLYTVDVLTAHKQIRQHLDTALDKVHTDKIRTQGVLATYEATSSEFTAIVAEYADVLDQIKSERWMLDKVLEDADN